MSAAVACLVRLSGLYFERSLHSLRVLLRRVRRCTRSRRRITRCGRRGRPRSTRQTLRRAGTTPEPQRPHRSSSSPLQGGVRLAIWRLHRRSSSSQLPPGMRLSTTSRRRSSPAGVRRMMRLLQGRRTSPAGTQPHSLSSNSSSRRYETARVQVRHVSLLPGCHASWPQLGEAMARHWQSVCAHKTHNIWQVCASVARLQDGGLAWESSNSHQQPPSSYQAPAAKAFPQPPSHSQQPAAANGWGATDQVPLVLHWWAQLRAALSFVQLRKISTALCRCWVNMLMLHPCETI